MLDYIIQFKYLHALDTATLAACSYLLFRYNQRVAYKYIAILNIVMAVASLANAIVWTVNPEHAIETFGGG